MDGMKEDSQLSPWQAWSYEVQQKLKAHQESIEKLECTLADVCAQLKKLEAKPSYTIENIQYHFDQLKVEKLEGTLNIGMTAPDLGAGAAAEEEGQPQPANIEQLSVLNGTGEIYPSASSSIAPPTAPYSDIIRKLNAFLDSDAHHYLLHQEQELELPLDPHHRRIIIEDVRNQMPTRIHYYLQQLQKENQEQTGLYPDLLSDKVYAKSKRDAENAMNAYMRQLKASSLSNGGYQPNDQL